jgi:hypothetical protein
VSKIYEVHSVARGDGKLHTWGARRSRSEAEALLAQRTSDQVWANKYHERWWIEEIATTGMFEIPSRPTPRERFSTRASARKSSGGGWDTLRVDVLDEAGRVVAAYDRGYPNLYRTFEPFRQGERLLALISSDYTATSVLDLVSGEIIAAEEPSQMGFCPVGFYVPDWWDIHDETVIPGSTHWTSDRELPNGDFGFVWGCVWGDDSSWKVQYLDLARVQQGEITRDERFGYVELASHHKLDPREFINCSFHGGGCSVTFSVLETFDVATGKKSSSPHE